MSAAINTLMKASRFKLCLEIGGRTNPGYHLFVTMAKRLGVEVKEVEVESKPKHAPFIWLSDHSTPNQRAWVPDMQHRAGDYHVMLPFYLRYHLTELRKHEPDFPAPKVDNLYVTLLWSICFGPLSIPLSARVLKDLLAWERATILTAHNYVTPIGEEIPIVNSKISSLTDFAQMYLGFWDGIEAWKIIQGERIEGHAFNVHCRKFLNVLQLGTGANTRYPVLVRQYCWDVDQLITITKNSWALSLRTFARKVGDTAQVKQCLLLRLQGKSEEEVRRELKFTVHELFYKWQVNNLIDIDPGRLRDPMEAWVQACKYFNFEPNGELLDQVSGQVDSGVEASSPNSQAIDPGSPEVVKDNESSNGHKQSGDFPDNSNSTVGFRHGPDFRSVVAANGKPFILTAKQAAVIKLLHESYVNATPDLSQGYLIEEGYGSVKENNLKKLFDENEAWEALIESGKRKGLVRLRVSQ